jgi:hypothetical protein
MFVEKEDCGEEPAIDKLYLVSKEERIDFIDEENSIRRNISGKDIGVGAVMDVSVVSE